MTNSSRAIALACATLASGMCGLSAHAQSKSKAAKTPQVKFTEYKLANGLRVILSPDSAAPVIAVSVTYDVGSRNEREGRTGFAHLFEHMMFQGSTNVGKGEHFVLINDNGGNFNGTTNSDRTNYFETLPANQLDLALFLEADRMRGLDITQANLDNQRAVVQEERRQSYDNQPYGKAAEMMEELAYKNFAYKHSTIGSMADLNAATLQDVKEFFKINYAPNNAVIAVVGDFKLNDAKAKVQKYFGSIPSQPAPPKVEVAESMGEQEQRKSVVDPLARLTRVDVGFKTVAGDDPDYYALSMLGQIISRGRQSRLRTAITEKNLAMNAMGMQRESRGPGLFSFSMTIPP
ncbi:MAG: pitrilysin family protein, partial [Chthonomonadales bacterium]